MFFSGDYYLEHPSGGEANTQVIAEMYDKGYDQALLDKIKQSVIKEQKNKDLPVLYLEIRRKADFKLNLPETVMVIEDNKEEFESLRNSEVQYYNVERGNIKVKMIEDHYQMSFYESLIQLFSLLNACLVLFIAYYSGSKDSKIYLTNPFKKIFEVLNQIIRNPLDYTVNPYYVKLETNSIETFQSFDEEYAKIGKFLYKYSLYLSYSFGSQNCDLVTDRLIVDKQGSFLGIPHESFCGYIVMIQLSDSMLHVSQTDEKFFEFTKKAHEIIQRTVDKFGGATNCLFDGKFVCTWRLHADDHKTNFEVGNRNSAEAATMCITCILKLISKLLKLREFFNVEEIVRLDLESETARKKSDSSEDRTVHAINCIFHCGRIYSGLVGSVHKGDVLYLGPDIAYISKLHDLSIIYNVPLMLTETVYHFFSDSIKKQCRKIDIIKMEKAEKKMDLYSFDIDCIEREGDGFTEENGLKHELQVSSLQSYRLFHSLLKERIFERLLRGAKNSIFFEDPDIQGLFKKNWEFKASCQKAIDFYSLGAWDMAREELERALGYEPEDGACIFLLNYISEFEFQRPGAWRGFRQLAF